MPRAGIARGSSRTTTTANSVTPASRSARCTGSRPIRPSSISARSARRCFRRCGSVFSCCPTRAGRGAAGAAGDAARRIARTQLALADFIETGEYGRHLAACAGCIRDRRRLLLAALDGNLSVPHQIEGGPCGLHLALRLPARYRDRAIVDAARAHGIGPFPLSGFRSMRDRRVTACARFRHMSADAFEPMLRMLSAIAERVGGESPAGGGARDDVTRRR